MSHGANCGRRVTWTSGVERAGLSFAPLPSDEPASSARSESLLHFLGATPVPTAPVRRAGVKVDLDGCLPSALYVNVIRQCAPVARARTAHMRLFLENVSLNML